MSSSRSFSMKTTVVMIGDVRVTGFYEGDDVIQAAPRSDTATPTVGADGHSIVSLSADDSADITLKLLPNSPQHKYLSNLKKQQRDGVLRTFPVSITDTTNGEGGASPGCSIQMKPGVQFGDNASVREWSIFAPCWEENEIEYAT